MTAITKIESTASVRVLRIRDRMTMALPIVLAIALIAGAFTGSDAHAAPSGYASIPFADMQGIKNWEAEGNTAIQIEARNNRWYRATFFAPCIELPWHVGVGFVTEPNGSLDRFSSIIAGGERCYFKTFEEIPRPE